jgi:hypothetical protein
MQITHIHTKGTQMFVKGIVKHHAVLGQQLHVNWQFVVVGLDGAEVECIEGMERYEISVSYVVHVGLRLRLITKCG